MRGQDVDHVDQPARERSELLVTQPDATVEHAALGIGKLVREPARAVGRDTRRRGDTLGRPLRDEVAEPVDALDQIGDRSEIDQVVGEEHVHDREQERRVGAGRDGQPLARAVCCAGAARIDHDDLATARLYRVDLAHEIGARQQRTL